MNLLIVSLLPLLISPLCYEYIAVKSKYFLVMEKIFFCIMAGLIVFRILPDSYEVAGPAVLFIAFLGWAIPSLLEKFWHEDAHRIDSIPLILSALTMGLHSILDGLGIALADPHAHSHLHSQLPDFDFVSLPVAIIIHRFFEMLFLWILLRPRFGLAIAAGFFVVLGLLTVGGFFYSSDFFAHWHGTFLVGCFEALVAGALLHLVTHKLVFLRTKN